MVSGDLRITDNNKLKETLHGGTKITPDLFSSLKSCKENRCDKNGIYKHRKKMFFIKDFFSKCGQISRKLGIWSKLLKKSLMENFILCAVISKISE